MIDGGQPTLCLNGHPMRPGAQFCTTCGSPAARSVGPNPVPSIPEPPQTVPPPIPQGPPTVPTVLPPLSPTSSVLPPLAPATPVLPPLGPAAPAPLPADRRRSRNRSKWIAGLVVAVVAIGIVVALVAKSSSDGTVTVKFEDEAYNTTCADAQTN